MLKFQKDVWADYESTAHKYLSRPAFKGSPITAKALRKAAEATHAKTGIIVPVELALAQAQFESHMGTKGRNPKTNPYNVGEYDAGTKMTFADTQSGIQAYFDVMARDYLKGQSVDGLLKNFVNVNGDRYASNPAYEENLRGQVAFIRKNFMGAA